MQRTYGSGAVLLLFLAWGAVYLDRMSQLYLAPYYAPVLHITPAQVGLLASVLGLCWAGSSFVFGGLSDRIGRRAVLIPSMVAFSLLSVATCFVHSFTEMLVVRGLLGIAEGPCWAVISALTEETAPPQHRGRNVGIVISAASLVGLAVAPVLTTQIAEFYGWRWAFLAAGAPGMVLAVIIWLALPEPEREVAGTTHAPRRLRDYFELLRYRNLWLCCLSSAGFLVSLINTGVFAPLYITQVAHQSASTAGLILGASGLGGFFISILIPSLADRIGRRPALIAMALSNGIGLLMLLVPWMYAHLWVLSALLFVTNTSQGIAALSLVLIPTESVPARFAATAIGASTLVGEIIGSTIAPALGGMAATLYGLGAPMLIAASGMVLTLIAGIFMDETAGFSRDHYRTA